MKKLENIARYTPIGVLKELKNNPRTITKAEFERLKKSVQKNDKFFEAHPIIASDRTGENVILAGNQRFKAAKQVGLDEVPAVILHGLTEEEEREIKADLTAAENLLEKYEHELEGHKKYSVGEEGLVDIAHKIDRWCAETETNLIVKKDGQSLETRFSKAKSLTKAGIKMYEKIREELDEIYKSDIDIKVKAKAKLFDMEVKKRIEKLSNGIKFLNNVDRAALGSKDAGSYHSYNLRSESLSVGSVSTPKEVTYEVPNDAEVIMSSETLNKQKKKVEAALEEIKKSK